MVSLIIIVIHKFRDLCLKFLWTVIMFQFDDVNLNDQLDVWEKYYNLHRPHSSHKGFTPYEVLKAKLENKEVECQS